MRGAAAAALLRAAAATPPLPRLPHTGSWSVGALRLPDAMGRLIVPGQDPLGGAEWKYCVGHLLAADGTVFSLLMSQMRVVGATNGSAVPISFTTSTIGVGDPRDAGGDVFHYYEALGNCLHGEEEPQVTWDRFDVSSRDIKAGCRVVERLNYTGGDGVGLRGSTYQLTGSGKATTLSATQKCPLFPVGTCPLTEVSVDLALTDERGVVLEGTQGVVGNTFELAQPRLSVRPGSRLTIGSDTFSLAGGMLWNDMQVFYQSYVDNSTTGAAARDSDARRLLSRIAAAPAAAPPGAVREVAGLWRPGRVDADGGSLGVYQWLALQLDSGAALLLVSMWDVHAGQWASGDEAGRPAHTGYGNLFRAAGGALEAYDNDGRPLVPLHNCTPPLRAGAGPGASWCPWPESVPWDYASNILTPDDPGSSPHWTSPNSGRTYATAVVVKFGSRLAAELGLERVYVYATNTIAESPLSSSTENVVAASVWDRPKGDAAAARVGMGVLEQYGYD